MPSTPVVVVIGICYAIFSSISVFYSPFFRSFFFVDLKFLPIYIKETKRSNVQGYKDSLINQVKGT
jgi:hypothetical protein